MKSVLFRRLLVTLTICMLLASAIMVGGYAFLIGDAYADIKLEEMEAKVVLFRQLVAEWNQGNLKAMPLNGCALPLWRRRMPPY